MDDYSVASLVESKNEWCARLVNIMTPSVIAGLKSIFEEAWSLCISNDEEDKYLMTFQTFLSRVPKWNNSIIEAERRRIIDVSSCAYLEDLITCVHIIQLKALTCIRVGQEQKKVNIDIPSVDIFVHRVYIAVARKVYTNVYLFEKDIPPLDIQKHNRELEIIIKESILNAVRDSMPVEDILKAYISETQEDEVDVQEEVIEKPVTHIKKLETIGEPDVEKKNISAMAKSSVNINESLNKIKFSDTDHTVDISGEKNTIVAPKTDERLEQLAKASAERRRAEESADDSDTPLKIGEAVTIESNDISDLSKPVVLRRPPILNLNIETLESL